MNEYILNGENMTSRENAYEEIARVLHLPDYFGENLDALWDVLSTLDGSVRLSSVAVMLNALGAYGCRMLAVFYDAAKENERFIFKAE